MSTSASSAGTRRGCSCWTACASTTTGTRTST
jgi:hypothetical protein